MRFIFLAARDVWSSGADKGSCGVSQASGLCLGSLLIFGVNLFFFLFNKLLNVLRAIIA